MTVPRFNLPAITFCEKSAAKIEADFLSYYEELTAIALAKGDPRRIFAQAIIAILTQQRAIIDYAAKQNLLGYADADNLDHLGALTNTARLPATAATVTVRFNLSTAFDRTLDAGVQVKTGNGVIFATTAATSIAAGQTSVDVECQCTVAGTVGNGYLPGEINQLVALLPWVTSVVNTTESDGGTDVETDDAYAERIRLSPEKFSVAGPDGAYVYWARTASPLIIDVSVTSPTPGIVEIRPLMVNGGLPSQEIIDAVLAICNDRSIRPLTDQVTVLAPTRVDYNITLTYYILSENRSIEASIKEAVTAAIDDYKLWQKSKLGRDINPSELIARIKNAGAKRVTVTAPAYTALTTDQVASEGIVTVTYGGLEDD